MAVLIGCTNKPRWARLLWLHPSVVHPTILNRHDTQAEKQSFFISCVYVNSYSVQVLSSTTGESVIMFLSSNVWYIILDNVWPVMPAKATLFDLNCNPLFDFGTGPRNDIFFNPHGNNILFVKKCSQNKCTVHNYVPCKYWFLQAECYVTKGHSHLPFRAFQKWQIKEHRCKRIFSCKERS